MSVYGLKLPSRTLCALAGPRPSSHRFLVGTCSAKEENELQLIEYDAKTHDITCTAYYTHPEEIWHIDTSGHDTTLLSTVHSNHGLRSHTHPHSLHAERRTPTCYVLIS